MNYILGMKLKYLPDSKFDKEEIVEVVGLRKRGHAKLSNGWVVDDEGKAEGNKSTSGGKVVLLPE